ncbi:unnamed protein product [Ceutorhynchus assimilis]|uniref:Uncharacterized protein n=1 Tax=Ceutorhynchus assimilis TaxID=467358 RepID=A0A9N9QFM1_9CUCU|nr:unnamed protein product [Ceutorhynchus assimilis]
MQQREDTYVVVDEGHLLYKIVWPRGVSFGEIAVRYVKYLQNYYRSNIRVVFDGYPSTYQKKTPRALNVFVAMSSPDAVFDETTIAPVSQEKFLSNNRNKVRLIDMLKVHLDRNKILTLQAEEDADRLIVTTAISMSSTYDAVKIAGEDIDLLVMLCGLSSDGGEHTL